MDDVDPATTAWLDAVATRSYSYARQLLQNDQNINVRGQGGVTALHVVAQHGLPNKIRKLLLDGADPSATNAQGYTPLRVAQKLHHKAVVLCLVHHDELLRALTETLGRPPVLAEIVAAMQHKRKRRFREEVRDRVEKSSAKLITAARHGDLKTVRGMLEAREVTIDAMDPLTGETAFSAALATGQREICEYLLHRGAHLFAPCIVEGQTQSVLVKAVNDGDVGFVRQLVEHGAMLAVPEMDPLTCPLAEAVKIGSIEMLTALKDLGARASPHRHGIDFPELAAAVFRFVAWNTDLFTPWWLLAIGVWHQHDHLIEHLFKTNDVLNDREVMEKQGGRALFLAVYREDEEIATALIDRGASINQRLKWNLTPMVAAVAVNSVKMIRFLLDRGGDVNVTHKSIDVESGVYEGQLASAIHFCSTDCAHELLPMESRPEHRDRALAMAIKHGDVEFAQVLLDSTLPSTTEAFQMCASRASCPVTLDLLLTCCCAAQYPVSALNACYKEASRDHNVDLVSVFIAHGFDVTAKTKGELATDAEWRARRNSV